MTSSHRHVSRKLMYFYEKFGGFRDLIMVGKTVLHDEGDKAHFAERALPPRIAAHAALYFAEGGGVS